MAQFMGKKTNPDLWCYERIVRSLIEFEKEFSETEEIGARPVSFEGREVIHIEDVGFWGPDLIMFYGKNVDGRSVQLMQHITQVGILLVALPTSSESPKRIGSDLEKKLSNKS